MAKLKPKYLVIDGCPCPYNVAPYVYLTLRQAKQTAASIYRGNDPEARIILNRHGKHTQYQLEHATPAQHAAWGINGTPNRSGFSQHELFDQNGNPIVEWKIGVDSGSNSQYDKQAIEAAAHHLGLVAHHPYPTSAVEGHHWQFARKPRADGKHLTRTRVILTRAYLRTKR